MSRRVSGKNHHLYGKGHSKESKEKMSKSKTGKKKTKEQKIEQKMRMKEIFKDLEYREKWLKNIRANIKKPTKPERRIIKLIKKNNLSFYYVGRGEIWFRGKNNIFNPDFIHKSRKLIIEVFGNYWHNLPDRKKLDKVRLRTYKKYGYKTLIIWESYILENIEDKVLEKILNFEKSK